MASQMSAPTNLQGGLAQTGSRDQTHLREGIGRGKLPLQLVEASRDCVGGASATAPWPVGLQCLQVVPNSSALLRPTASARLCSFDIVVTGTLCAQLWKTIETSDRPPFDPLLTRSSSCRHPHIVPYPSRRFPPWSGCPLPVGASRGQRFGCSQLPKLGVESVKYRSSSVYRARPGRVGYYRRPAWRGVHPRARRAEHLSLILAERR